jgi:glycosyltransferase involved in cell wall biosynthesis
MESYINTKPILGIIAPCFNEEILLKNTINQLSTLLNQLKGKEIISSDSFIALIDDGSKDKTWQIITEAHLKNNSIKGLKLAANAGQAKALLAGLMSFKDDADCIVTVDADLQDDISVIEEMIQKYHEGNEVVYGVRKSRDKDTFLKKQSSMAYYNFMKFMKIKMILNHAEFRMVSKRVLDTLVQFGEVNLFLRGIFPIIGFNQTIVYHDRLERLAGQTKYSFRKLLSVAWESITSLSSMPLRMVSTLGFLIFIGSLFMIMYSIISKMMGYAIQGWTSIVLPMYFLGGIQLLCIGIIGEYIAKIYNEVKSRPRYIVDKKLF